MLLLFAKILYRYTGGIPRLICRACESLLGLAPSLTTKLKSKRYLFSNDLPTFVYSALGDGDRQIVLLAGLLDQLGHLSVVMNQGRILELMLSQSLGYHLAFATTFGAIPGLKDTVLGKVAVPRDVAQRFTTHILPSFQTKTMEGKLHIEEMVPSNHTALRISTCSSRNSSNCTYRSH